MLLEFLLAYSQDKPKIGRMVITLLIRIIVMTQTLKLHNKVPPKCFVTIVPECLTSLWSIERSTDEEQASKCPTIGLPYALKVMNALCNVL